MRDVITSLDDARAEMVYHLRERVLDTAGVEERVLYDGFCREWTPAFYVIDRQLFHIHSFRPGLRATVFIGGASRSTHGYSHR